MKTAPSVEPLIELLKLEQLDDNLFRGQSGDIGTRSVYGGQVLGQALRAAGYTVDGRRPHSLHAYFLRAGDFTRPIIYEVEKARDGRSFTSRRVVAIQGGQPILNLAASFQTEQEGIEHQAEMPDIPPPEQCGRHDDNRRQWLERLPPERRANVERNQPFEFCSFEPPPYVDPQPRPAVRHIWFRANGALPDDAGLHEAMLAYASDFGPLMTALYPSGINPMLPSVRMASLDHAMWYHRPFRVDQWLLYALESPNASGSRGFTRGSVFTQDGTLVASTAQEGMIRVRSRKASE